MKMNVTIGISLSSRNMGIAVLRQDELLFWKVQSFNGTWSKYKRNLILGVIRKYLICYEPTILVLKVPAESYPSKGIIELTKGLEMLTAGNGIKTRYSSQADLQREFRNNMSRRDFVPSMMSAVAARYPELHHEFNKIQHTKSRYYCKLAEAIACALPKHQILP